MRVLIGIGVVLALAAGGGGWWYFYGPCGKTKVAESHRQMQRLRERWADALNVAGSTPRIALAGPLDRLQAIRTETKDLAVAACMEHPRNMLALAQEKMIAVILKGMAGEEGLESPISEAQTAMMEAIRSESETATCAPLCN